jgi:O-antigen/teichoic acid export membrane protein
MPSTERAPDPLAPGSAGATLARGGTVRIAAYASAITLSVAVLPFVTRHLGRVAYGRYVVVTTLILIVTALSEGGVASLGVREFACGDERERREFMRSLLGIRIALSGAGALAAIAFALLAGYPAVEVEGTAIACAGLVLAGVQVTLTVPLTAALRLRWLAVLDVTPPIVTSLVLIALVIAGAPLLAFFIAAVLAYAASLALTAALVRGQITLRPAFDRGRWRALLRDSAVFAAATALATIYFQVVLVATSVIASSKETGSFSIAFRVLSVVNGIAVVLVASAFPVLLRAAHDEGERLRAAVSGLLEASLLLGGWLSLLVVAAAPFAIRVLGGSNFPGAAGDLRILGAGVAATYVSAVLAMALLTARAYRALIAIGLAMIALSIVLCAILIPGHGAHGAAVVTLTLELVLVCVYASVLFVMQPALRPPLARPARIVVAIAIGFLAALVPALPSVAAALVGSAALALTAVALRAVPSELLTLLRARR